VDPIRETTEWSCLSELLAARRPLPGLGAAAVLHGAKSSPELTQLNSGLDPSYRAPRFLFLF
jgi:hypothetical protein